MRIELYPHQFQFLNATEPYVCLCTGIGGGKTFVGALWCVTMIARHPDARILVTVNSYDDVELTTLPALQQAAEMFGLEHTWVPSRKIFVLSNGGKLTIRSTELRQRLRGPNLDAWWGDEVRVAHKDAISVMWGRMRGTRLGKPMVRWTTSPNGFDHVHETFVENADPKTHRLIRAITRANLSLPEQYHAILEHEYDDLLYRQEALGEFLDTCGGRVWHQFDRSRNVAPQQYNPYLPLFFAHDFNVNPLCAYAIQCSPAQTMRGTVTGTLKFIPEKVRVLKEYAVPNSNTYELVGLMAQEWGPRHKLGDVWVFGDASGHHRQTSASKTDYAVIQEELERTFPQRVRLDVPLGPPSVKDRVETTNAMLRSRDGSVRLEVDPSCKLLIGDFEKSRWKVAGIVDKEFRDPHGAEAIGYYLHRRHRPASFRAPSAAELQRASR